MLNQDTIREATRLTRAGQLAQATALLQRMLRGERASDATSRTPRGASPCQAVSRLPSTPMTSWRSVARTRRGPHPLHPAGASRYSIEQRMAPGSECEA